MSSLQDHMNKPWTQFKKTNLNALEKHIQNKHFVVESLANFKMHGAANYWWKY